MTDSNKKSDVPKTAPSVPAPVCPRCRVTVWGPEGHKDAHQCRRVLQAILDELDGVLCRIP